MKKIYKGLFESESGVVHILPLFLIVAAVGIISYLLISSTAPLKGGLFGAVNPKPESHAASPRTYFTNFPATENPISEGGNWINGKTDGLDWTDVKTTPGKAFGTQLPGGFDDSISALTGTWGPNQGVIGKVFVTAPSNGCCGEVEVHVRRTITPHFSGGYEFNCSTDPNNGYAGIIRWPGPLGKSLGDFVTIADAPGGNPCRNGDTIAMTVNGSTLTAYHNGVQVAQGTDTTYTTGSPGIGFYVQGSAGPISNWGFTSFAANDSGTVPSLNPTPTPSPTPSATPNSCPKAALGDTDCNGTIDIYDFNTLVTNFGKTGVGTSGGDFDGNGKVDIFDFNTLVTNFGK